VCGGVDAARQARDDAIALPAELASQHARHLDAGKRGVARTDDGDGRQRENRRRTLDREQWRRVIHALQERRIIRFADADESRAVLRCRLQLGFRFAG
jgi:hypothetical protein